MENRPSPTSRRSRLRASSPSSRRTKAGPLALRLEVLEDRCLLNCSTISGYVYYDLNDNGVMDAGEQPLANSQIQLLNAAHAVVGTATTDAQGFYQFSTDATIDTSPRITQAASYVFGTAKTNQVQNGTLPKFDSSLGTLTEVDISFSGQINSDIQVENRDPAPATVNGTVSGNINLSGPDFNSQVGTASSTQTFNASAFDGQLDMAGTSGKDFGWVSVPGSSTLTLTSAAALADYTGPGTVSVSETSQATSGATGGGNLSVAINSTSAGTISVAYHYIPENCLAAGNYTIVQTVQPPGYLPGKVSSNGTVLPGSFANRTIAVTLQDNANLTHNDFGQVLPAGVSGYVYYDANNDGMKQAGESGIGGTTVTLTGTDDTGASVNATATTAGSGASQGGYAFGSLRPGVYTITETQPAGYADGKDTIGSLGGTVGNDIFSGVVLAPGAAGVNYNFGELLPVDLAITKTANPTSVAPGAPVVYTLTVKNLGTAPASGVAVQDQIPAGETFDKASGPGWTISQANGMLTATLASLDAGASSVITVNVQAPQAVGSFTNTATVSSSTPDTNPGNNSSQATITTAPAQIAGSSGTLDSLLSAPRDLGFLSKAQFLTGSQTVSTSPVLYVLGSDTGLYRHDASGWSRLGLFVRSASTVTEASGNVLVYAVLTNQSLFCYSAATGWAQLGGAGTIQGISAGTDAAGHGDVFVLTTGGALCEYSNAGWVKYFDGGTVKSVVGSDHGRAFMVTNNGMVYGLIPPFGWLVYTGAGFASSISAVTDALGNVVLFAVTPGGTLYRHDDATGWIPLGAPGTVASVTAGTDTQGRAEVLALMMDGSLFQDKAAAGWMKVGSGIVRATAGDNGMVFVVGADGSVLDFSTLTGWQRFSESNFAPH